MMTLLDLFEELLGSVHRWVNVPPDFILCRTKDSSNLRERCAPNDHEIDIAGSLFFAGRHGSIDEGDLQFRGQRLEGVPDHVSQARRLAQHLGERSEDRGTLVRLVVHPVSVLRPGKKPSRRKYAEFVLNARRGYVQVFGELVKIPGPLGMQQRGREDTLLHAGREGIEKALCAIHSYNYTIHSYDMLPIWGRKRRRSAPCPEVAFTACIGNLKGRNKFGDSPVRKGGWARRDRGVLGLGSEWSTE